MTDKIAALMHGKITVERWLFASLFASALLAGALLGLVAFLLAVVMLIATGAATFWTPKKKAKGPAPEGGKDTKDAKREPADREA